MGAEAAVLVVMLASSCMMLVRRGGLAGRVALGGRACGLAGMVSNAVLLCRRVPSFPVAQGIAGDCSWPKGALLSYLACCSSYVVAREKLVPRTRLGSHQDAQSASRLR